ncbi:hypothetical protein QCA50_014554 [Cerrena zonata]|uniref:Cytochrome P450 n=1 Tax=Cerrena zonata TaxID=2478898 RepID=A0AAW0FS12_9APHY
MISQLQTLDVALLLFGLFLLKRIIKTKRPGPFPPGPKGLPLIGNILDMPRSYEWLTFSKWANRWGNIVYLRTLGQSIVVLNSYDDAVDMLEKRSSIYSDRPALVTARNISFGRTAALVHYGDTVREYRRLMGKMIGTKQAVQRFHGLIEGETQKFIRGLLDEPNRLHDLLRRTSGAIILMMTYGYSVEGDNDYFVNVVDKAIANFSLATSPGTFMMDIIPSLRFLPKWFPGMKRYWDTVATWNRETLRMIDEPYDFVKQQMQEGVAGPSYVSKLLESENVNEKDEESIKCTAASLYAGGGDTTVSANYSFFLAMTLHPSIQVKAQQEIDRVIGTDRLPTLADRQDLSYIEAIVKEVFRWNPVLPIGFPHSVTQDDIYKDYFIPKGSMVLVNAWYLLHDPNVYSDPLDFNPDRFLGDTPERDPRSIAFGFGRRICPGLNMADTAVFIACAQSLAVFNISKVVRDGIVVEPDCEYEAGTVSHPKKFECRIEPRSAKARKLILLEAEK